MSENPDRSDDTGDSGDTGSRRTSSAWFVAVPAATFVLGGLLGGLVVGVGAGSDAGSEEADGSPTSAPTTPGPSTAVVVPDSCLEAADTVQQAVGLIRNGVEAIQEFRVDPILTLLDDLEDLDTEAREQAASCTGTRITDAGEPDAESPSESPTESASESSEPTPDS